MKTIPSNKRQLVWAWIAMMMLSLGTMIAGKAGGQFHLGIWWALALLVITGVKARIILARYLNLSEASKDWNGAFTTILVILLLAILGIFLVIQ
jgi:hypothetical protein